MLKNSPSEAALHVCICTQIYAYLNTHVLSGCVGGINLIFKDYRRVEVEICKPSGFHYKLLKLIKRKPDLFFIPFLKLVHMQW